MLHVVAVGLFFFCFFCFVMGVGWISARSCCLCIS